MGPNQNWEEWERTLGVVVPRLSRAALNSLLAVATTSRMVRDYRGMLEQLAIYNCVKLVWVPSHCVIQGNARADGLARRGASDAGTLPVRPTPVSEGFVNGLIAEKLHRRFSNMWLEAK
ncbi:hypothetical protein PV327_011329, partial [Microctonus hyperodae]